MAFMDLWFLDFFGLALPFFIGLAFLTDQSLLGLYLAINARGVMQGIPWRRHSRKHVVTSLTVSGTLIVFSAETIKE